MRTLTTSLLLVAAAATTAWPHGTLRAVPRAMKATLQVTASFENGAAIPSQYTCDGAGMSPQISWSKPPTDTISIAVLVQDSDAPRTYTHWVVTGIAPTERSLAEGGTLPGDAIAGKNDNGTTTYASPCPPSGVHHYHFRVFALDIPITKAMTASELLVAIDGHVLAQGELVGTYRKEK